MKKNKAKKLLNKLIVNKTFTKEEYLSRVDLICSQIKKIFPETNISKCNKIQEINIDLPRNVSDNIIKAKLVEANTKLNSIIRECIKEITDFEMESERNILQDNKLIQLLGNILFWSCLIPLLTISYFSGKTIEKNRFDKEKNEMFYLIKVKSDSILLMKTKIGAKNKELKLYQDSIKLYTNKNRKKAQLPIE